MARRRRSSDPLGPIEFIVSLCASLMVGYALVIALLMAFAGPSSHVQFGAWGDEQPCLAVPQVGLTIRGADTSKPPNTDTVVGLRDGVSMGVPNTLELCRTGASAADRALLSLPTALDLLWTIGFLVLTLRLVRGARRDGLFTRAVACRVENLGRYVLFGWLVVALVDAAMRDAVVDRWVADFNPWMSFLGYVHWSWAIVIAGFGVITVGRVMRQTVPMREEIEATV